ncbi:hypothetical protein [Sphingobium subterraneum]|uniref:Uncharacterized protein n=1 Tax=Sphingobium subterraneum TaxID=627688 RepID=A0A841J3I7_9SPHN|nr:hypothetical protein [Sphingobium subterraneum]MBB6124902.1 hypothetical protein [Sphingobium subterraneum]
MAFEQREEFFLPGRTVEQARADAWGELIGKGLLGLAIGSMWWWGGPDTAVGHEIYLAAYIFSPLIGLGLIVWGIVGARRSFQAATLPVVDKLAYALDPKGIHLLYGDTPALMPWVTLFDVVTHPNIPGQLTLVHRPEGGKVNERRLANGGAHSHEGTTLAERLPLWRAAMAAGGAR